jgi:hypothetical protein
MTKLIDIGSAPHKPELPGCKASSFKAGKAEAPAQVLGKGPWHEKSKHVNARNQPHFDV